MRNFDINDFLGYWYVIEYYASSEEAAEYSCMKCNFSMSTETAHVRCKNHSTPVSFNDFEE